MDLTGTSLEDLMNIQVTSVSKKEQKLSNVAAAIYVINQEEIRRSGATCIPDLLRMVPGANVAQLDGNHWAISIRGFNDLYGDKVLVVIDGRSVFRETNSAVYWETIDVPLPDIERIEVIRGPGGTVWGANAVNGVINIITKNAGDTQGGLLTADVGTTTNASGLAQYGGKLGSRGNYRVFGNYYNSAAGSRVGQQAAADASHEFHAGFRSDWNLSSRNSLTVEGNVDRSRGEETLPDIVFSNALPLTKTIVDEMRYAGGNVLARWNHTTAKGSEMSLQAYDERYVRTTEGLKESGNTLDVDFHHHLSLGSRHDVVWGFDFRTTRTDFVHGINITFVPADRTDHLYSAFLQDEIKISRSLSLTLGSKFEHNSYTGFEFEPGAQLAWEVNSRHTLWASASRAIRQPSRRDLGLDVDLAVVPVSGGGIGLLELHGTPNVQAEKLLDFELGHRAQLNTHLSLDSVAFLSLYRNLAAFEPGAPFFNTSEGTPHLSIPQILDYQAHAHNYGVEFFANWNVNHRWKLSPGFSLLHLNLVDATGQKNFLEDAGNSPRHTFEGRSFLNLRKNLDWDSSVSAVGPLRDLPGYTRLDSRLGWRFGESMELSLVGQNLLTPRHAEFPDQSGIAHTLVRRNIFVRFVWKL